MITTSYTLYGGYPPRNIKCYQFDMCGVRVIYNTMWTSYLFNEPDMFFTILAETKP